MRTKRQEYLFLACFIALIAVMYLFSEIFVKPRVLWLLCPFLTVAILCIVAVWVRFTKKEMICWIVLLLLFSIIALQTDRAYLMTYGAVLCGAGLTTFRRIVISSFCTCGGIVVLTYLGKTAGFLSQNLYYRSGVSIETFGFGYYHVVPYTFCFMVLEYLYLRTSDRRQATWLELLVILGMNYGLFAITTLRLTYYLMYFIVLMYIVLVKIDHFSLRQKWISVLTGLVFPIAFAFSIWINYVYDVANPIQKKINEVLSDRLALGHEGFARYSVHLLGQKIETSSGVGSSYFYIDCGYLYSLLGYGVLFTAAILCIYVFLHAYSTRTNNKMLFIWLTTVAVFSFSNNIWISVYMNPVLLMLPIALNTLKEEKNEYQIETTG